MRTARTIDAVRGGGVGDVSAFIIQYNFYYTEWRVTLRPARHRVA